MKSWVMPSVEDILTVTGMEVVSSVDVGSGVDVNAICMGSGVSEGVGVFVEGTVVAVVFWQAAKRKMESERVILFIYLLNQLNRLLRLILKKFGIYTICFLPGFQSSVKITIAI